MARWPWVDVERVGDAVDERAELAESPAPWASELRPVPKLIRRLSQALATLERAHQRLATARRDPAEAAARAESSWSRRFA